jgi:hypothetical protein
LQLRKRIKEAGCLRQARPKIHLLDTDEPLVGFFCLLVRCGAELRNAKPKFHITEDMRENFNMPLTVCRDCLRLDPPMTDKRVYLYGLTEAQSAQDAESGEETDG